MEPNWDSIAMFAYGAMVFQDVPSWAPFFADEELHHLNQAFRKLLSIGWLSLRQYIHINITVYTH